MFQSFIFQILSLPKSERGAGANESQLQDNKPSKQLRL